jgi:hypothetical protein
VNGFGSATGVDCSGVNAWPGEAGSIDEAEGFVQQALYQQVPVGPVFRSGRARMVSRLE